jgi:hypothetical protein
VEGVLLLVQTTQGKAYEVSQKFKQASKTNPYEFISWKYWTSLHSNHKEVMIKKHNTYIRDYKLSCLSGFNDDNNILLGKNPKYPKLPDYSELTLNEFLAKHYVIKDEGPMFLEVIGLFLGM